ncbi:MAG: mannose/fructose/sorbose PTS transporter subunit IIA [Lactococcus chungangensis]|jgi:PTS system, mannose/fructose/sorbose family, IIA component|uniref:PTS sugar transporter subunit IIA n=1 Tax=Pseudolactococcus chungangensis TaxID=451457 RepID=UPI0028D21C3D|nr:mannose/fructose/sorbose PTS transporter subunit IIA [Lactococcus chungangensis]MDD3016721.1 mannose/fructose/sorbose PTS transporter subunit IIA [Lactococcus chungangensis]
MTQVLLVAHGELAPAMKNSVEMIFGEVPFFTAISFYKEEGLEAISTKIEQAIITTDEPIFIFADLFCGTPYNASCAVAMKYPNREIEIVSGMSLPLVLEVVTTVQTVCLRDMADLVMTFSNETVKRFSLDAIDDDDEL